jgi:AmmeMemoRadiSam system protein B
MNAGDSLPALRPVDIFPVADEHGRPQFVLHDQSGLAESMLAVSLHGYFVLAHLDGEKSVAQLQNAFRQQFGGHLPFEQLQVLLDTLDRALLLDNERAAAAYSAARDAYLRSDIRDNTARWPDAEALRAQLAPLLAGAAAVPAAAAPSGIIAPHLDYARGAPCYREAYAALAAGGLAERYVILGTNHFGRSAAAVATSRNFRTPLGDVPTDTAFIHAVEQRIGQALCGGEFDHAREHSVELQVHLLQALHADRPFSIVPILCPDPSGTTGTRPAGGTGPDLEDLCAALAAEVAQSPLRTVLIAGADLSHVGRRFGDRSAATPASLEAVQRADSALLSRLAQRDDADFVSAVRATANATRICSVGCIYALLRALPDRNCRVLHYHQAQDWETDTHVTCCAAVVY